MELAPYFLAMDAAETGHKHQIASPPMMELTPTVVFCLAFAEPLLPSSSKALPVHGVSCRPDQRLRLPLQITEIFSILPFSRGPRVTGFSRPA